MRMRVAEMPANSVPVVGRLSSTVVITALMGAPRRAISDRIPAETFTSTGVTVERLEERPHYAAPRPRPRMEEG